MLWRSHHTKAFFWVSVAYRVPQRLADARLRAGYVCTGQPSKRTGDSR